MANPYPVRVQAGDGGPVVVAGELTFTDPGNQPGNGGSQPGAAVWRGPFSFAFDDAGLNAGITFYTPTVADLILAAAVFTDTAFDGTTPKFDVGTGLMGAVAGIFNDVSAPVDLSNQAFDALGDGGTLLGIFPVNSLDGLAIAAEVGPVVTFPPYLVTAANPLKAWASQDGFIGGDPVGGAAGAGRLYICTATPAAFAP